MWSTYRKLKVQALSSHGNFKFHTEQYFKVFPKYCEHQFLWDKYKTKASSVLSFFHQANRPIDVLNQLQQEQVSEPGGWDFLNILQQGTKCTNTQGCGEWGQQSVYLLLFTRHLLCPGTMPAIRSLAKMSNFFHVTPIGQRFRWKLQRTKKS